MAKKKTNQFWAQFWPKFGPPHSKFENLASSVTRYYGQLSSCAISEKTNDPILRTLSDGRTDGRTDGEMDESDFIGHCPTNVERQIKTKSTLIKQGAQLLPICFPKVTRKIVCTRNFFNQLLMLKFFHHHLIYKYNFTCSLI